MSPERGDSAGINVSGEHGGIDRVGDGERADHSTTPVDAPDTPVDDQLSSCL